jgi:CARDB
MRRFPLSPRAAAFAAIGLGALLASSCSDSALAPPVEPAARPRLRPDAQQVQMALIAQQRHTDELLRIPGVVGTAIGLLPNGTPAVRLFLASAGVGGLPTSLEGVPVSAVVTGQFMARSNPTTLLRPAPLGYSVGHFAITAGSIGARVVDGAGNVYILSNNHVLANSNDASIGDAIYQPGPYDGGTSANQIATLYAFRPIDFSGGANPFDAALALSSTTNLGNATPTDDGYGTPNARIFDDANADGSFDNVSDLLGLAVQKYGRTTKLTKGRITGINGTVNVCYEVLYIFCIKSALYTNQLIIDSPGFSGGGDSGSLIVTDDGTFSPVALLFAGSSTQTIANRIDLVLSYFGVSVDGGSSPPPTPVTDVAVTGVSAPASLNQGSAASVVVSVRNVGNQSVGSFDVSLSDATDNMTIGTQTVTSLAPGATTSQTFTWTTTSSTTLGSHILTATHTLGDDNALNNSASATSMVNAAGTATGMHIGDLDGTTTSSATSWSATVEVTVHDVNHNPLNGATVKGVWSVTGLNSNTCTTGELGGNGTCIMLFPSLSRSTPSVTFRIQKVTKTGQIYNSNDNHDVDGGTNGTGIRVMRP